MTDRLMSMAVFVKAVDLGSFAAAAAALELSAPMVGKHVRSLEERLGARLLNRTTRRQSLTEIGQAYYERCRAVLAEAEAADALAADPRAEPQGKLRVTMPVHFGRRCVMPLLLDLTQKYSKLELDLSFGDPLTDLAEAGYDLAIRTGRLADHAGMIARRVAHQHMIVCAAPAYLEHHGRPASIDEIGRHQAIIYRRSGRVRPWLFPCAEGEPAAVMPIGRWRFDDLDAIADAAAAGLGLAWLPSWLVHEQIDSGTLVTLFPDQAPYRYDVHALWLQTSHLPQKVRLAVDLLAAELPKLCARSG